MENITLGQNLKRIRKELELNQQEIVGQEITRNLISMIENDKSPMSYKIAQIAAENMNNALKEKGIEIYVDPDDIMKPERVEAKGQANKYIRSLKKRLEKKAYDLSPTYIEKIINFLNKWRIPEKKVEIYELLADIYYFNGDSMREYVYLNKALENYYLAPVKKDIYMVAGKLLSSCIDNKRYEEGLELLKLDIMNRDDIPNKIKGYNYYNEALIYKRLKNYDRALNILNKCEGFLEENNIEMYRKALILIGTCYNAKKENQKAIDVYKKMIERFSEDGEEAGVAYSNIINNYKLLDLKEEVRKYKKKLLNILPTLENKNNKYLVDVHSKLGKSFEYFNNVDMAEYHYICAINKAVDRKDNDSSTRILLELLNLYNKTNQQQKILLSNNIFKKGFENSSINKEMELAFSLVLTNLKFGKGEIASDIITDILIKEDSKNED